MTSESIKPPSRFVRWIGVVALLFLPMSVVAIDQNQDTEDYGRLFLRLFKTRRPWVAEKVSLSMDQRHVILINMLRYHETMKRFIESENMDTKSEFHAAWSDARWAIFRILTREQRDKLAKLRSPDFLPPPPKINLVRFLPAGQVSAGQLETFPTELIEPLWEAEGTREEYAALIRKCREDLLTWAIGNRDTAIDVMAQRLNRKDSPGPRYLLMPHTTPAVIKRFQNHQPPEGLRVEVEGSLIWLKKQDQTVGGPFWHDEEQLIVSQQFSPSGRLILTAARTQPSGDNYGKVYRWWEVATAHLLFETYLPLDGELAILDDETLLLPTPIGADHLPPKHGNGSLLMVGNDLRLVVDKDGITRYLGPTRNGDNQHQSWNLTQTTAGMLLSCPAGYLAFDETGQKRALTFVKTPGINTMWMFHTGSETFRPCHSGLKGFAIGQRDPDNREMVRGGSLFLSKTPIKFQLQNAAPN